MRDPVFFFLFIYLFRAALLAVLPSASFASVSVLHSAAVGGSVVGVVRPL